MHGDAAYGAKIDFYAPADGSEGYFRFGSMQGAIRSMGVFTIRMKVDILHWLEGPQGRIEEKYSREPGTFCGLILLVSTRNAEPLAIIQDGYLQHMRVAGSAGLATKYLARANASTVGMLGSGGMARTFLQTFCAVRDIKRANVYSPTQAHREAYAEEMSRSLRIQVKAMDSPEEAVRGTDILSVCTDAIQPAMSADWLEPGMHVTNSGRGMDPRIHQQADVIFKLGYGTPGESEPMSQGGAASIHLGRDEELAHLPEHIKRGRSPEPHPRYPHLVDLMAGKVPGRTSDQQVTYFIDHGTQGIQFSAVAGTVY